MKSVLEKRFQKVFYEEVIKSDIRIIPRNEEPKNLRRAKVIEEFWKWKMKNLTPEDRKVIKKILEEFVKEIFEV